MTDTERRLAKLLELMRGARVQRVDGRTMAVEDGMVVVRDESGYPVAWLSQEAWDELHGSDAADR